MSQLSIFEIVPSSSRGKLPTAIFPLEPKVEEAIALLEELPKLRIDSELVAGCTVRSSTAFKGKTAKLLRFEQISNVHFAVVEIDLYMGLIEYKCNIASLEVVA